MKRLALAALLLLSACDLRPSDNPPNEATALLRDPVTGKEEFCIADWWLPDTKRVDECIRRKEAKGLVLISKNYVTN